VQEPLGGQRLVFVGGGRREAVAAAGLAGEGAKVFTIGLPEAGAGATVEQVAPARVALAVRGATAIIGPVCGVDDAGCVPSFAVGRGRLCLTDDFLPLVPSDTWVFVGRSSPFFREAARRHRVRVMDYREEDDFAVANAVPTAEAALAIAVGELSVTIHRCPALVLGWGRVARPLAVRLRALGACCRVAARSPRALAEIETEGLDPCPFPLLRPAVQEARLVLNTVPAPVLTRPVLADCRRDAVILDLATSPGGVDFEAARQLGLNARLLPGLPGKVFPETAGGILARLLRRLIRERTPGSGAVTDEHPAAGGWPE